MSETHIKTAVIKLKTLSLIYRIIGGFGTFFFGLPLLMTIFSGFSNNDLGFVIVAGILTLLCVFLIISGSKKAHLIKSFYKYSAYFSTDPTNSIDLLSETSGISVDQAQQNITKMINNGLFKNAYIDRDRNCLVFPQMSPPDSYTPSYDTRSNNQPIVDGVTVQCTGCGATNEVSAGKTGKCEYCGSSIEAPKKA